MSYRVRFKPLISTGLILLLLFSVIPLFNLPTTSADPPNISLKWTGYVSGGGEALLTADVRSDIAGEEVFHAGGQVQPSTTNGSVRCLNGRTGQQVWQRSIRGIGDTATMQMSDVDLDGKLEIMVALQHPSGLYILNAEDGSVLWRAPGQYNGYYGYFTKPSSSSLLGGRIDGSGVVGDTDDDGTPDIFIGIMAYEEQPETGAIIHLEWNGATFVELGRVQVWHPCAGGLSLGDTDNDGTPELYMNERHVYFGDGSWGRGTTGFNVWNGTHDVFDVRWTVYDWGASSNIPMLVDVNKDGVLDVVSTNLGRGIMVLNSSTGKPLQNAVGTTLKSTSLAMHAHYQSSIYDIDGDGNLELLCADGKESESFGTQVFDLWNWQLDADLQAGYSFRGPSIGEVTGDGIKDIVVVTFDLEGNTDIGTVQVWDNTFQKLFEYGGLRHRAIGSVVQDVDRNDGGLNELLVLTQGGVIYCFDTPGLSEESQGRPRARSEVHFYSESRLGASENIPFDRFIADISAPIPAHEELGVSTGLTSLRFNLDHPYGELMDYVVTANFSISSASANNVGNGQKTVTVNGPLTSNTSYGWQVRVTDDTGDVTAKNFTFRTGPYTPNRAPTQTTPSIVGVTKVDDLITTPQGISDLDGNNVTSIYNWQKGGTSIANINLPFETRTDSQDEFSGLATTKDYAYGATAAVFGATWTSNGKVGGAYSFDGNDFIRIPQPSSTSTRYDGNGGWSQMSLECWVQVSSSSSERLILKTDLYDVVLPGEDNTTSPPISYRVDCSNSGSALAFTWRVGVGPTDLITEVQPTYILGPYSVTSNPSGWHHVVVTYKSGAGLRLYVDGMQVSSLLGPSYTGNIFNTDGPFEIAFGSGSDFRGLIDEVRLYPFETSPAMVNQRYQDTKDGLSTSSIISKYDTIVGEQWRCQVTPNDGLTDGTTLTTATRTITAVTVAPPSASNLAIIPASPLTGDDLNASYTFNPGSSGYPEYGSVVSWYKNGVFNFSNPTLPSALTAKGEVWSYRIIPSNGFANGTQVNSGSVTIANTPPTFTGGFILPNPSLDSSTLSAVSSGWFDADGDPTGYRYQWQRKVDEVYTNITGQISQNLTTTYFDPNDWIAVLVTAFDGTSTGNTLLFETLIVDSDPPVTETPTLSGSRDDDEIICIPGVTSDPDGDNVTAIFNWLKGSGSGTSITRLYLPFETRSTTLATDYSGYGNHGSISGANWTSGIIGGAYRFDGNDAIALADDESLGNDGTLNELTVECWVKPASDQSRAVILNKNGESASASGKYMMGFMRSGSGTPTNVIYFGVYTAISEYEEPSFSQTYDTVATRIPVGAWSHVVGTYQAGFGLRLYINGVLASEEPGITGSIESSIDEPLIIGYSSPIAGTSNRYFNGSLDEIRIYPNALSAAQIFQNYADQQDGESDKVTIAPQETTSDEIWRCSVTPNDGWQDGTSKLSSQLTITSQNTRPHIDWYSPASSEPSINIGESIDFKQFSSDPNESPLTYSWTLDSVQVATTQNWTYTPSSASIHLVRVTASDGTLTDYQEWAVNVAGQAGQYNLHVQVSGQGTTNATGDHLYDAGTTVAVQATANQGYVLDHWLLNGSNIGSTNPRVQVMNANYNLIAVFTEEQQIQYQLHVQVSGSGTTNATGDAMYDEGTDVAVQATPTSSWELSHWLLDNVNVGNNNPYIVSMNSNHNLTAVFILETTEYLFEDGFESGDFSAWDGSTTTTGGSVSVVSNTKYSGVYSGQFDITSGSGIRRAYCYKNFEGESEIYASARVFIADGLPLASGQSLWIIQLVNSSGSAVGSFGVRADASGTRWALQYSNWPYTIGSTSLTEGQWYLLEAYFTHASSGKTLVLKVNGEEVTSLEQDTSTTTEITGARYGVVYYSNTPALRINIDNVIIDDTSEQLEIQDCLVVRGTDNNLYYRTYNGLEWSANWQIIPGQTFFEPAAAIYDGKLHVAIVGTEYNAIYYGNVDLLTGEFSGWTWIQGASDTTPALAATDDGLCLVVKGTDSNLYYRTYDGSTWSSNWQIIPGQTDYEPAVAFFDGKLQLAIIGQSYYAIYWGSLNLTTGEFSGWTWIPGGSNSTPALAASQDKLCLIVQGTDNCIYYRTFDKTNWTPNWSIIPGETPYEPAAVCVNNRLDISIVGMQYYAIYFGSLNLDNAEFSGWTWIPGGSDSTPALA